MRLVDMQLKINWRLHKMNKIIKNYKKIQYGPALEDDKEVLTWIKKILFYNSRMGYG